MDTDIEKMMATATSLVTEYGLNVIGAILILVVGWMIAGWVRHAVMGALNRIGSMDATLKPFLSSVARYLVLIFVIIAVLNQFGVQTASIIALLGAAGLAVGLALQGTLSNVAAGMMLLILRPFKVGDFIDASGISGTVVEIGLFTSELKTFDGVYLMAPNSELWNKAILNFSRNATRRLDVVVGIAYSDDVDGAIKALDGLIKSDSRILADPKPQVLVTALGDSSVSLNMRFWVSADDFWGVKFDFTKWSKSTIESAGYSIPFPQQDVHMHQVTTVSADRDTKSA